MFVSFTESVEVAPNSTYTRISSISLNPEEEFMLTMIACVSPTDVGRVLSSLSFSCKVVIANCIGCCGKPRKCLEIQPQLANIIRYLFDSEGTGSSAGGSVGAGVVGVPDVGGVG